MDNNYKICDELLTRANKFALQRTTTRCANMGKGVCHNCECKHTCDYNIRRLSFAVGVAAGIDWLLKEAKKKKGGEQ